ncbi:MAG: ATP-binding protein [Desulfomonilaceae bacterium]
MERLRALAQNRRGAIEMFLEERTAQLVALAHTHPLEQLRDEAYLDKVFNALQLRAKSFVDIGVIDVQGNHVAYVGPYYEQLKSVNYAQEEWFRAVMSSGIYVSDVFMGFRKIPHFVIAVTARSGNQTWILRATINSDIIDNIIRQGQIGSKGDAFIIDRKNLLQTSSRFSGELFRNPTTPDLSSSVGTNVEELGFNGERVLFATSRMTAPSWVIVIRQDFQEEMAPLFTAGYTGGLVLVAGILLIVTGTILTSRSITNELIRIEQEKAKSDDLLVQSNKMAALGKMAAGIAHEINNPLAIIVEKNGWVKELLEEADLANSPNFPEIEDCFKKIERQIERCKSITHRMLLFARQMEPSQEMVDVNLTLAKAISFFENEARFREIAIEADYNDRLPRVTTDTIQLQQVFLNILNNAIDAVGRAGSIHVKTSYAADSKELKLEIADNGPGIPKEVIGKIFDPFFTTKTAQGTTGLGLSISYTIIQKLGGRITVTSAEGQGTTFTIFLPSNGCHAS